MAGRYRVYTHAYSDLLVTATVDIRHGDSYVYIMRRAITLVFSLFQHSLNLFILVIVVLLMFLLGAVSQLVSVCSRAVQHYTPHTHTSTEFLLGLAIVSILYFSCVDILGIAIVFSALTLHSISLV